MTDASDTAKTSFRAPSPSAQAARMRLNPSFTSRDQRDDGVSTSRRDAPDSAGDPAISDSTAVKTAVKASSARISSPSSPTMAKESTTSSTLRNLADVAGLTLHDTPPQVPVDKFNHPISPLSDAGMANTKAGASLNADASGSGAGSDVDPEMLSAISKLVATKQAAASGSKKAPESDVASLTRQIEQMAQRRRTPTPGGRLSVSTTGRARPSPEDSISPRSQARSASRNALPKSYEQGRSQMDLKNNDNSFCVIADLVLQPFKRGATFSAEAHAQLDKAVPQHLRESFVEALRYRIANNCPPGSSQHVHVVTRKCQVLGFDKEGDANPLLSLNAPVPQTEESKKVSRVSHLSRFLSRDVLTLI